MEIKLNLVPPSKKEELKKNKRLKMAIKTEIAVTMILLGFFVVLMSFKYSLNMGLAGEMILNDEIEMADQFGKIKNYDSQFSQANEKIKQIASIDQAQFYWSRIFLKISRLVPDGIEMKSLAAERYSITITGLSDTRDNLIGFKSKLESEKCFSNIVLPLSNLIDKSNVEFQIVFNVDEKCLKIEVK